MDLDLDQLAQRILRPDRPRLAEARAAVAGIEDPKEAWEVLVARGVAPLAWLSTEQRRFAHARPAVEAEPATRVEAVCRPTARGLGRVRVTVPGDSAYEHWSLGRLHETPPTIAACVALASDPRGAATAEACAREITAAVARDGTHAGPPAAPSRVVWCVGTSGRPRWDARCERFETSVATLRAALGPVGAACSPGWRAVRQLRAQGLLPTLAEASPSHLDLALVRWAHTLAPPRAPRSAWTALASLLATGYGLDAITDDAVVLVAPEVTDAA